MCRRLPNGKQFFGQVVQDVADALRVPYTWVRNLTGGPFDDVVEYGWAFAMLTKLAVSDRGLDMRAHNPPDPLEEALAAEEARVAKERREQALQQRLTRILAADRAAAASSEPA